jgi:hypothetical protein
MKVGGVEGTPEEIRDTFENHGLRIEDYLLKPEEPLPNVWMIVPAVALALTVCSQVLFDPINSKLVLLHFLAGAGFVLWLVISVQLKFKNPWAAGAVALGGLLILLVAAGFIQPQETALILKGASK